MSVNVARLICANTQDEGFGSVYERIMLEELLKRFYHKYDFKTILEYGCRFTKGYDNLVFMKENCEVTLADENIDKIENQWKFDVKPDFSKIDDTNTTYDLAWSFAIVQLNPQVLRGMKKTSHRYVLFFTPNVWNYGTAFHIIYHLLSHTECHHPEQGDIRLRSHRGLKKIATENGLTVLESGYVDIPWWPDTAFSIREVKRNILRMQLDETEEQQIKDPKELLETIYKMTFIEKSKILAPLRCFFAHHTFVFCKIGT